MGQSNNKPAVMKGIKSATEYLFSYKDGILEVAGEKESVTLYDEKGYETESFVIGPDKNPSLKSIYIYDEAGRLSEEKFCDLIDKKESIRTYSYDSSNRLVRKTYWSERTGNFIEEFTYSPEGLILEEISYFPSIPNGVKKHYEYSSEDGIIRRNKFSCNMLLSSYIEEMIPSGRKTEEISFNGDGTVEERIITEFNTKNLPFKSVKSEGQDPQLTISTYKYDENDRLIEESFTGALHFFTKHYSYNTNGNLSELTIFRENGEPEFLYKIVYEYYS